MSKYFSIFSILFSFFRNLTQLEGSESGKKPEKKNNKQTKILSQDSLANVVLLWIFTFIFFQLLFIQLIFDPNFTFLGLFLGLFVACNDFTWIWAKLLKIWTNQFTNLKYLDDRNDLEARTWCKSVKLIKSKSWKVILQKMFWSFIYDKVFVRIVGFCALNK